MPRNFLTVRELGEHTSWLLVQQATGIPDAKLCTNEMEDKVAFISFAQPSLPERLCITAAFRQMGGATVYESEISDDWRKEMRMIQTHLLSIFNCYLDCMYMFGYAISETEERVEKSDVDFPVINAGAPDAHPAHALADIACIMRTERYLDKIALAWIGRANGTLRSLIAAAKVFPISLKISMPSSDEDMAVLDRFIHEMAVDVAFVETPAEAVNGCNAVYAGIWAGDEDEGPWHIDSALMKNSGNHAHIMLGARPIDAVPVESTLLSGKASLLPKQSEYRLRLHKRILHWVFDV
ncbi:MAG: ornithine carbamoyltransferase [Desulfovibrio sp.]|nr:ornithine carbamoyltransferase [Desulfovibrio sp.]